ncbi:MAG TPA: hypothetical protein VFR09_06800 [Alphaproteobacteria bacterium]|nr:hypothetical protein [Alphaproteobacteria bacterium]
MTDAQQFPTPFPPPKKSCLKRKLICFLFSVILIVALAVAFTFCPWFEKLHGTTAPADVSELQQRVTTLENQVRDLGSAVNAVNAHANISASETPTPEGPTAIQVAAPTAAPPADIAKLQVDVGTLTAELAALQNEVKQTGSHAAESQQATQTTLATAIAFIQLREAVASGQAFTTELATMRDAARNDTVFQDNLTKLEPFAAKGAPTLATLRENLLTIEPQADVALDKANAQGWWQGFLAELKGLVSIRKQHGAGATDAFAIMESDLAKNDIPSALTELQNMPAEAQQPFAEWREGATARAKADDVLHDMAAHFTSTATATPGAPPAPNPGAPQGNP